MSFNPRFAVRRIVSKTSEAVNQMSRIRETVYAGESTRSAYVRGFERARYVKGRYSASRELTRSAYARGFEHAGYVESRDEKSASCKHCEGKHGGKKQQLKLSVKSFLLERCYDETNSKKCNNR